jgi:DNA-binding NarL/FixJ family response regulator
MTIKLIVADDQEVIRRGLASLLSGEDIQIVAEAATGNDAVSKTKKHKPNVLLMDVLMPDMDGLDALERIRKISPTTKVIMTSASDNPTYLARAAALGASDFLLKDVPGKAFAASIKRAVQGESSPADSPLSKIRAKLQTRPDPKADDVPLTRREYQVLLHLVYGLSNREIGTSMSISIETVKEHVQNIMRKLGTQDRTAAAYWAAKRGLSE